MMTIYLLKEDPEIPTKCNVFFNWRERKTDYFIFMEGVDLPAPDVGKMHYSQNPSTYDLIFDSEVDEDKIKEYDCLPNNTPALLVNARTLELLQKLCSDCFQAFPATIISNERKVKKSYEIKGEYWLINITKLVDVIDVKKSDLIFDEKYRGAKKVEKLKFRGDISSDSKILLARERLYRPYIVASGNLKIAFQKNKIKGCRFVTDEEYNRDYF